MSNQSWSDDAGMWLWKGFVISPSVYVGVTSQLLFGVHTCFAISRYLCLTIKFHIIKVYYLKLTRLFLLYILTNFVCVYGVCAC